MAPGLAKKRDLVGSYTISSVLSEELRKEHKHEDSITSAKLQELIVKNDYTRKSLHGNASLDFDKTMSYKEIMEQREFEREEVRVKKLIEKKKQDNSLQEPEQILRRKRKRRWDVTPEEYERTNNVDSNQLSLVSEADAEASFEVLAENS